MSKAPKSKKKSSGPKRGLRRGLSALMDDVGMDAIMDDAPTQAPPTPKARKPKAAKKQTTSRTKSKANPQPKSKTKTASKTTAKTTPKKTVAPNVKTSPASEAPDSPITYVAMDQLTRNPDQPRRYFDSALLDELADSIKDKGVLQPVLVRHLPKGAKGDFQRGKKPAYQIIAGERRWQAALKAGLDTIPVFVRDITDREALEIGVVENVHRADLNPMEEALAYKSLLTQFSRTQEDVARAVGKSRPYIANMLRLLNLPESVQTYLAEGKITTGHARAIIAAPNPQQLADMIVEHDLSVRDAESLVRRMKNEENTPVVSKAAKAQKAADVRHVEERLSDALGLSVDLRDKGGRGELRLKYKNGEQLEGLIERLIKSA